MAALPDNILTQVTNFTHSPRLQRCWLVADDLPGIGASGESEQPPWGSGAIGFQYWPESLTDSRASEWTPKNIPGGSHPIYQWTSGGERGLSFTAVFTTDTNPGEHFGMNGVDDVNEALGGGVIEGAYAKLEDRPLSGLNLKTRDIDLRSVISWLRWFTYPSYDGASGGRSNRVFEPAKALLVMPNTGLGYDGTDYVRCVMRSCQVTYQAWFPNGLPRIIEVSLEFSEVVQSSTRVAFQNRRRMSRGKAVKGHLGPTTDTSR